MGERTPEQAPRPGEPGFLDWVRTHSGLRIDAEGTFRYLGEPVDHPRVVLLFKGGLARADDGRVRLTVGRTWCFVDADGPLFVVRRARVAGGSLEIGLDDGTTAVLDAPVLATDEAGVLHVRVRDGVEWGRFRPEAQAAVAEAVVEAGGGFGLRLASGVVPIAEGLQFQPVPAIAGGSGG